MDFTKKNNFQSIDWGIDTKNYQFKKLADLPKDKKEFCVNGFFFTNGQYGKQAVAIIASENALVNLPKHKNEVIEDLLKDNEAIEEIKKFECGIKIEKYTDKKFKKECYSFNFVNLDKPIY